MSMNCSQYNRLVSLLQGLLIQLNRTSTDLGNLTCTKRLPTEDANQDAFLYILLIMIFYAFLAGGLILVYTRSRNAKAEEDPSTNSINKDGSAHTTNPGNKDSEESERVNLENEHLI